MARAAGAIQALGGRLEGILEVDSHGPGGARTVVVVAKEAPTPGRYPRKPKQIARAPL